MKNAIAEAWAAKHPDIDKKMTELFGKLLDYGDNQTIFQLPDGRFVKAETVFSNPKGEVFANEFDNGIDASNLTFLQNNESVTPHDVPGVTIDDNEVHISYKPRDYTVRRELKKDPDFDAVASGRAKLQPYINTATSAAFNAAAREGIVGAGLGLDEKRETALWNKQLSQLRPLVTGDQPLEQKRQMADAIMNVMTYGLDNLPEEMFRKNPNAYKAIANQLGSSDWSHWSENKVPDYPTTSY